MGSTNLTDLKDFTLCPVIPWIRRKLGWREPVTRGMRLAKDFRADVERVIPNPLWEVRLRDEDTGLSGIVDVLGREVVAEVKAFPRSRFYHFRIQLLGYSYLAERNGFRVRNAILFMGRTQRVQVEVRREHLEFVEGRVRRLADILEDDSPPIANPGPELCRACQYRRVCPVSSVL